jgi:hypothetical protein
MEDLNRNVTGKHDKATSTHDLEWRREGSRRNNMKDDEMNTSDMPEADNFRYVW